MWKPDDSLDDFTTTPALPAASKAPREVSLRLTGKVRSLKPLVRAEKNVERRGKPFTTFRGKQPLWFRRFLVVGSGAIVLVALALVSAILVGINESAAGPEVASTGSPVDFILVQPQELYTFDFSSPSTLALSPVYVASELARSSSGRRTSRARSNSMTFKPRRHRRRSPQPLPKFIPTTLVIYAENGVINTRIEPWLQASHKTPPAFHN